MIIGLLVQICDFYKMHVRYTWIYSYLHTFNIQQSHVHQFSSFKTQVRACEEEKRTVEHKPLALLKELRTILQGLKRSQNNGYFAHKKPQSPHHNLFW